jgi:pimeloyl-ACP methyl ester carboxylesterase
MEDASTHDEETPFRSDDAILTPPYREHTLTLRDGRRLAYAEFGDPEGDTVLWFHGTPGARLQLPPDAARIAEQQGLRLVGIDRPGVGGSTPHPERTLESWARDVEQLSDALRLERFGVAGLSGGGPHVLAVARFLRERVNAAALLGGMGPLVGPDAPAELPRFLPRVMELLHTLRVPLGHSMTAIMRSLREEATERAFPLILRTVPPEDREVIGQPAIRKMFIRDIYTGSRHSFRAQVQDMSALGRHWGFRLHEVSVPTRLWHGTADRLVPLCHAENMAKRIPNAELVTYEGEGHFAGFVRARSVLGWLKRHAKAAHPG